MRRSVLLAMSVVVSGCVPERDNPLDSSLAPEAALDVIDTGVEGACGTEQTSLPFSASRGRCLSLYAGDTTDPQSPISALRFRYVHVAPDGSEEVLESDGGPDFVLPPGFKRRVAPGQPQTFRVDVVDPSGARGSTETVFTFNNDAPAAPGFSPRTLPLGGFPASTDTTFSVELDGRFATDPDGDDRFYTWRVLGTAIVDTAEVLTLELPVDVNARYLAELVVSDGNLSSAPSVAEIAVRTPNLWLDMGAATPYTRIDSLREPLALPGAAPGDENVRLAPYGADLVAVAYVGTSGGPLLSIVDRTTLALVTGPVPLGKEPEAIAVDEQNGIVSVLERSSPKQLSQWNAADLSPRGGPHVLGSLQGEASIDAVVVAARDGTTWVVGVFGRGAYTISPAGALSPRFLPEDDRWITGVAARPDESGEVWMLQSRDVFSGAGTGEAELLRFAPGRSVPDRFQVGENYATGLAFADANRVWLALPDAGLALVDVRPLDPLAANLALGIERIVPQVQNALHLLADRETGTCWANGFSNIAYRVGRDFTVLELPSALVRTPLFVDPDGALWFLAPGESDSVLRKGLAPSLDGTMATFETTPSDEAALDPASGGLLVARLYPPALLRVSETAKVVKRMELLQTTAGDIISVPPMHGLRMTPDGNFLWAKKIFARELVRLDVSLSVPIFDVVLTEEEFDLAFSSGDIPAFVPTNDGTGIWALTDVAGPRELVEVGSGGTESHVVFGVAESDPRFALAPETGRLCVVTKDLAVAEDATRIRVLQEGATDPVDELVVFLGAPGQEILSAAASYDPVNGDVCWGLFRELVDPSCSSPFGSTLLRGWRVSDGQVVASYDSSSAYPIDSYFESEDVFWLASTECDASDGAETNFSVFRRSGSTFTQHRIEGNVENDFLQLWSNR